MHHNLPSDDPAMLAKGVALIQGMALTAVAASRNRNLSKENRAFFKEQECALFEVVHFVQKYRAASEEVANG